MKRSEEEWKQQLSPEQYRVMRQNGTEDPFSGSLLKNEKDGTYRCAACGAKLFSSESKFDSGSGWPSFDRLQNEEAVVLKEDVAHGMRRVEVSCASCGGHLGHVFNDGPTETGKRFCINSCALDFDEGEV